jgi:hypothetical protein
MASLCLSYFLAALDATIIIPAIGVMGKDLGAPEKVSNGSFIDRLSGFQLRTS